MTETQIAPVAEPGAYPRPLDEVGPLSLDATPPPVREAAAEVTTSPGWTALVAFCSAGAAGWMAGGVFRGTAPRLAGLLAAALGSAMVALSYRRRRVAIAQYFALPAALVGGALLVVPDAKGGTANLPSLVAEAIRNGGLAQPPLPFDPGWRFLLFVLVSLVATSAASLAVGLGRPRLAAFLPVPLTFAAMVFQPPEVGVSPALVAFALTLAALAVSFGVELGREQATSGLFEVRRLTRAAMVMVLLVASLLALTRVDFLFPEPRQSRVVPPQRPPPSPPQADRVIFTVESDREVPWRLGVLDGYDGVSPLTPPLDPARLVTLGDDGVVPSPDPGRPPVPGAPVAPVEAGETPMGEPDSFTSTFTVLDLEGHALPQVANFRGVEREGSFELDYDPRTQTLRLRDSRARSGQTYRVEAPVPPSGVQLAGAGPPPLSMEEFLEAPLPPAAVAELLAAAPTQNLFERLQFVRNALYENVVAAKGGDPVLVPPRRVPEMLAGGEATPFEISAAEVLLSRWAGVPARMGFGYFGGERNDSRPQVLEIRPRHGRTWLEVYFDRFGWVPIVGTPPKAKSSLSSTQEPDPVIRPADDVNLVVYVPVRLSSIQLLFELIRYWIVRVAPWATALGLAFWLYPAALKALRRGRRRRWAARVGPRARIAAAYADFRDFAHDLNIGSQSLTPLEFVDRIEADEEHLELAWLVTRSMWGDLTRDLRDEDVQMAEESARSLRSRLRKAHSMGSQIMAAASRRSLKEPFAEDLPNLWLRKNPRLRLLRLPARLLPRWVSVILLLTIGLGGCARQIDLTAGGGLLPENPVPDRVGDLIIQREPTAEDAYRQGGPDSLVDDGRVFTIRNSTEVLGALQIGSFKPGLFSRKREVRAGVIASIGEGNFELTRLGDQRIYRLESPDQRLLLWFPPQGTYFELMVAKRGFDQAEKTFLEILAHQQGRRASDLQLVDTDLRRGIDD